MAEIITEQEVRDSNIDIPLNDQDEENTVFLTESIKQAHSFIMARLRMAGFTSDLSLDQIGDLKRVALDIVGYYLNSTVNADNDVYRQRYLDAKDELNLLANAYIKISDQDSFDPKKSLFQVELKR